MYVFTMHRRMKAIEYQEVSAMALVHGAIVRKYEIKRRIEESILKLDRTKVTFWCVFIYSPLPPNQDHMRQSVEQ